MQQHICRVQCRVRIAGQLAVRTLGGSAALCHSHSEGDSDTAPHRAANQALHCREPRSENCLAKGYAEAQGGRGEIIDSFWHLPQKVGSPDRS